VLCGDVTNSDLGRIAGGLCHRLSPSTRAKRAGALWPRPRATGPSTGPLARINALTRAIPGALSWIVRKGCFELIRAIWKLTATARQNRPGDPKSGMQKHGRGVRYSCTQDQVRQLQCFLVLMRLADGLPCPYWIHSPGASSMRLCDPISNVMP
jgi:hypothetical protein